MIQISAGGSLNDVLRKFGSLEALFNFDGDAPVRVFSRRVLFFFPSSNTLCFTFTDGWMILEQRKAMGYFKLTGVLLFLARLFHAASSEGGCLVRGCDPYFSGFAAWLTGALLGLPYCVSIHSDYDLRYKLDGAKGAPTIFRSRKLAKMLERFTLTHADMVLPIRQSLADKAVELGVALDRIRIIPHGVDFEPFRFPLDKTKLGALGKENRKIISFAGRLSKENYVDDIIAAARMLSAARNDFVIVMAGGGSEEERLRRVVRQDELLSSSVTLKGFMPRDEVFELRKASAIGLALMGGFSLIEACAAGRPVVAYDVEWHNELVIDGETGFLVKEGDIEGLARAVSFLLDNPAEADRIGGAAHRLAFERHDIQATSVIKRKAYEELLAFCPK
ncbi:MAG: glycosyltransferase family 4 protein [Nitrospinota bacterium]|nr:glycosyltransferase family 4 protein [Nitrospinota bacterium]